MIDIKEIDLNDSKQKKEFVNFDYQIYANDPYWVCPLRMDVNERLNPKKHPFYKHANIKTYMAYRNGNPVGRIAAIENHAYNEYHGTKVGFFGFFESINDAEVSEALFNQVVNYHREMGNNQLLGPVNPSTNYEAGLLTEGFDSPPQIMMTYNPKYYIDLITKAGFSTSMNMFAYKMVESSVLDNEKLIRVKNIALQRSHCTLRYLNKGKVKTEIENIKKIYNKAWENNWGFVPMSDAELDQMGGELKLVADEKLAPMIENEKGEVVAFALALRNINQLTKSFNGHLFPFNFLKLLFQKNKIDSLRVLLLGILPEYRNKGLDSVLYYEIIKNGFELNIKMAEASWILENNEAMNRGMKVVNGEKYKTYSIYEKQI